ncbi:MAG TPA: hypothetical protein VJV79_21115 [Polyangiaceae bacterium]|nr:hypothetical protein [Polyangiaceae bacterium]
MPEAPPRGQLRLASQDVNLDEQATVCAAPKASEPKKSQYL